MRPSELGTCGLESVIVRVVECAWVYMNQNKI